MTRDPLALLARLRAREVDAAGRAAALAQASLDEARERAAGAAEALLREREGAGPGDYAAWLARGRAARDVALRDVRHAEARAEAAQTVLTEARGAARAVERLIERRAEAAARQAARRERAVLDAAGLRRAAGPRDSGTR